jgi:hypothetical protein
MTQERKLVGTTAAATAIGVTGNIIRRLCDDYPGFGIRFRQRGSFYIPAEHIERLLRGESPDSIAAEARARGSSRAA